MGLAYNPSTATTGLELAIDAGSAKCKFGTNLVPNPSLLSTYAGNQSVTVSQDLDYIRVVSNQTNSTPGVWPIGGVIPVLPLTRYTMRSFAIRDFGTAFGAYALGSSGNQLVFATTAATSTPSWIEQTFTTGATDTSVRVGYLWSAPVLNSAIKLKDFGLFRDRKSVV